MVRSGASPWNPGSVADAGRHRYHGLVHEAAHNGRECAVHAGDHHDDAGGIEDVPFAQDAVDSGNAHVIYGLDSAAEHARRYRRFLGNGNIRGACR